MRGRQKRTKRPSLTEDRAASVPTLEQYSRMVDEMCRNFVEQQEKELQAYMEQQEKELQAYMEYLEQEEVQWEDELGEEWQD